MPHICITLYSLQNTLIGVVLWFLFCFVLQLCEVDWAGVIVPILSMRKVRYREIETCVNSLQQLGGDSGSTGQGLRLHLISRSFHNITLPLGWIFPTHKLLFCALLTYWLFSQLRSTVLVYNGWRETNLSYRLSLLKDYCMTNSLWLLEIFPQYTFSHLLIPVSISS